MEFQTICNSREKMSKQKICPVCRSEFEDRSGKNQVHCSRKCFGKVQTERATLRKSLHAGLLTQGRLKELLSLDETSGTMRWRQPVNNNKGKPGDEAGCINPTNGRVYISIDRHLYSRSRLVFLYVYGWLPEEIDHKDRNRLNDRPENLRPATSSQNKANTGTRRTKRSGLPKGVYRETRPGRPPFYVEVTINRRKKFLCSFHDSELAHKVYLAASQQHHGEFSHAASSLCKNPLSPAVRDYLGLAGLDRVDWRFVERYEVPSGPW